MLSTQRCVGWDSACWPLLWPLLGQGRVWIYCLYPLFVSSLLLATYTRLLFHTTVSNFTGILLAVKTSCVTCITFESQMPILRQFMIHVPTLVLLCLIASICSFLLLSVFQTKTAIMLNLLCSSQHTHIAHEYNLLSTVRVRLHCYSSLSISTMCWVNTALKGTWNPTWSGALSTTTPSTYAYLAISLSLIFTWHAYLAISMSLIFTMFIYV